MSLKYKNQIMGGIGTAFLVWGIFLIADTIDEFILKTGTLIGTVVLIMMPLIMTAFYIVHFIKHKIEAKKIIIWFINYYIVFLILWFVIFSLVNTDKFFIIQNHRTDIIDLNGLEYTLYGFSALLFFSILCILFHCIFGIVKRINTRSIIKKVNNKSK